MDIQVASNRHDCSTVLKNIDTISADLLKAKSTLGHALCLCTSPPRKLQIRSIKKRLFLAVWPWDGKEHHYACPFHRDEVSDESKNSNTEPALREDATGWDICTDFKFERIALSGVLPTPLREPQIGKVNDSTSRKRRSKMGLLGILQHLWVEAQLNQWGAHWKRNYWRVTQQLLPQLEFGKLAGRPLTECLYLVPEFTTKKKTDIELAWERFKRRLNNGAGEVRFGLILGEVKSLTQAGGEFRLTFRHQLQPVFISSDLRSALATAYSRPFHQIGKENQRVICMLLMEQKPSGHLYAIDGALMATSLRYIPVDSSYEAQLAEKLADDNRSFIKPMKLSEETSKLPDFVLTDTQPAYVLEVFGLTSDEYLERKAEKLAQYRIEGKPVWQWSPTIEPLPPAFPTIATRTNPV